MKSIPLIRARYAKSIVDALIQHGAPIEKYLLNAHLPLALLENGDGLISAHSMWKFVEDATLSTGILDLGYWAGMSPMKSHGDFGSNVVHAPSLHAAIYTFCNEARAEYSEANFYLTYDRAVSWFCRGPFEGTPEQRQQAELHNIMFMIQTIQLVLGAQWHPKMIRLQRANESALANNEFFLNTNIQFGCSITAVAIPTQSLATPMPMAKNNANVPKGSYQAIAVSDLPTSTPLSTLRLLISNHARQTSALSIDIAADMAGVSVRKLQRFLQQKGTTYSSLIDQTRYALAVPLLNDKTLSITAIAYQLGYADLAHFSRNFRRFAGMSPSSYRQKLKE
jgi:AraC-like DNA-binding protein